MHKPLVSIVTPSYNQGQFIEQTILSIKSQSYPNIEHIVIDGGSQDQTLDILRQHEGTYNMRWFSESDTGMYNAINKGFRHAKGEILAYLNSDDNYMPWSVEVSVDSFIRHPDVDLVYGGLIKQPVMNKSQQIGLILPATTGLLKRGQYLEQPTAFWRRRVYEKLGGFSENFVCAGDIDFWRRAVPFFKFIQIREVMAIEQAHSKRLSVIKLEQVAEEMKKLDDIHLPELKSNSRFNLFKKIRDVFGIKIEGLIFIFSYLMRNKIKKDLPYARLFGVINFIIKNPINYIVGCIPFFNRGFKRWWLDGNFKFGQKGVESYEPSE